jgi:hypothetical protein
MASLLATLVLDQDAMAALQARGEGPPMFRTTLRQLSRTLARLKASQAAAAAAGRAAEEGDGTRPASGVRGGLQVGRGDSAKRSGQLLSQTDYRGGFGLARAAVFLVSNGEVANTSSVCCIVD